jgi:dTDP-4-dehydrorhamnose reductase
MPAEKNASSVLIVGSDGLIGAALMEQLEREGICAQGTTRRRESVNETHSFLDLSENVEEWQMHGQPSVAVICAGVTKIESCRLDPVSTARVNVQAISRLADKLTNEGIFVIYLSTNQVFDGSIPNQLADDQSSARTEYGKQKAEVERYLLSLGHAASIVRLTKVLQPQTPLLRSWLCALRAGEAIRPFADMVMSPIPLSFTMKVLLNLIETRLPGVIQVSGGMDVTYAQVAYHIAARVGVSATLVKPISVRDAGIPFEAAPPHTTLDVTRLRAELGLEPPGVWTTIDSALGL